MEDTERLITLWKQGFFCSQIIMLQGLAQMGKENADLVRAIQGLAGGLGFSGELCGALSGGAALLGLHAGKGTPEEEEDPRLMFMTQDLVDWFISEYSEQFGGIRCEEILASDEQNQMVRCPLMIAGVLQKVNELLDKNGYTHPE